MCQIKFKGYLILFINVSAVRLQKMESQKWELDLASFKSLVTMMGAVLVEL